MDRHLLNRRQFSARCAAFGLSFPALSATLAAQAAAQVPGTGAASRPAARTVKLPDGTTVPALGQGCWHLGQGRHPPAVEEEALRTGISLGMTLIDTSGNYGNGRSEQFIGHVIAGQRDRIFLVSKVEANEVSGDGFAPGAYPTSTRARWKICSVFRTAIAARPTRSLTVSATVALSVTFCPGARS